jgi:trehalose-6-phosphate synthase
LSVRGVSAWGCESVGREPHARHVLRWSMSRLVVISNRVADLSRNATQSGGLAVALGEALAEDGGLWFGWDGSIAEDHASRDVTVTHYGAVSQPRRCR